MDLTIKDQLRMMAKKDLGRDLTDAEADHLANIYEGKVAGSMEDSMTPPSLPKVPSNLKAPEDTGEPVFDEPQPAVSPEDVLGENAKTQDRQMTGLKGGAIALAPAALMSTSGKSLANAANLVATEGPKGLATAGGNILANAPAIAYGSAVARQLAQNLSDPKLAETAKAELESAKNTGTAAGYLNFPQTAELGAEKIASAAIPTEATNLIGTLAKALTGTARGGLKALTGAMGAVKPVGEATKGFLTDPSTAPAAKMIAALVGASDKATEGEAIARLLGAPAGTVKAVSSDSSGLMGLFDKPYSELTAEQKDFVKNNFDTYMKYRGQAGGNFDKDIFKIQQDLRKDFETAAKPYRDSAQAFNKLDNIYKNIVASGKPTKAQTLAMGYNFMKTLDPGSTVRESEFGMLGDMGMLPASWQALYNKTFREGAFFGPAEAKDMMDRAKEAFKATQDQHDQLVTYYSGQAIKIPNTKPSDVIVEYSGIPNLKVEKPKPDPNAPKPVDAADAMGIPPVQDKPKQDKPKPTKEELDDYNDAKKHLDKPKAAKYVKDFEKKFGKQ